MKKKKSSYLDGYIGAEKEARREVKAKAEESWWDGIGKKEAKVVWFGIQNYIIVGILASVGMWKVEVEECNVIANGLKD